ncbi:hypothetical protein BU16DRAFT_104529 [Lophium mytilinum]|uniref:Uncharacterized protein n=1 Tax=Lophium mytilinum TaxID=390894 RepID=A0A6A6QJ54_9PEZI|nr:hypothetical protein BU16DRAFT_104529 [Lophium mytilinum]
MRPSPLSSQLSNKRTKTPKSHHFLEPTFPLALAMHSSTLLAALFLSFTTLISANWVIVTTTYSLDLSTTFKNEAAATKWENKKLSEISKALSTYLTHLTADPKYASYTQVVHDQLATATDVPDVVTATGTTTTYTTVPKWFTRLPNDVQNYYHDVQKAEISIWSSVAEAAAARATPGAGGMGVLGAAGVAAVGAVGAMLI